MKGCWGGGGKGRWGREWDGMVVWGESGGDGGGGTGSRRVGHILEWLL